MYEATGWGAGTWFDLSPSTVVLGMTAALPAPWFCSYEDDGQSQDRSDPSKSAGKNSQIQSERVTDFSKQFIMQSRNLACMPTHA